MVVGFQFQEYSIVVEVTVFVDSLVEDDEGIFLFSLFHRPYVQDVFLRVLVHKNGSHHPVIEGRDNAGIEELLGELVGVVQLHKLLFVCDQGGKDFILEIDFADFPFHHDVKKGFKFEGLDIDLFLLLLGMFGPVGFEDGIGWQFIRHD